jgi:radical SAM protein with 4Fe4S-binding SPASM domain
MEHMLAKQIAGDRIAYYNWMNFIHQFDVDLMSAGYLTGATFELTAFCTLKCPMCYVRIDKERADALGGKLCTGDQWIDLARQFRDQGGIFLLITGGEAMLHPEFPRIYSEISKMGLLVTLFTNGTTVDDKMIELLKERPPAMIGITIYGASEDTYRRFGGSEGSFQRAMDGLDRLLSIPNIALDVRFTACRENYKDFKAVYDLAIKRNKMISLDFGSCAPVRGAHSDARILRISKEELKEINEVLDEINRSFSEAFKKLLSLVSDSVAEPIKMRSSERGLWCKGGKNSVYIAWDGRMYPCDMASYPYSFPLEQGFKDAAFDIRSQIDSLLLPEKCTSCFNKDVYCNCIPKAQNEMKDSARTGERCNYIPIF